METVAPYQDIIAEIKRTGGQAYTYCYQCGKCDVVCPWNKVRDFSIRKIIREACFGLPEIEFEDMWRCTTCGTCPAQCPRGVEQIEVGVSLRRIATEYGVFPGAARAVRTASGSLATDGNPLSEDRDQRDAWVVGATEATGLDVPEFTEDMEMLFFVGCYYSYDPRMKKVATAVTRLLHKAGISFGILGTKESCCGESIRKTGNEELFKSLARHNIKEFIDRGVKKVLVCSPHCYHTFINEYSEFMVRFEVVHITQLLLQLIEQGRINLSSEYARRVTFHDPCYLGRHNGVYDEPRALLQQVPGLELVEMSDCRENSLCCGGGGGRIWMETPKDERFADLRLAQAVEAGASVLATSCPYCISNFEEARLSLPDEDALEVVDIAEIIAGALQE